MDYAHDGESDYTFCKYTIAQKSIQTFYKFDKDEPEDEVMGIEHTDENYGLNYKWRYMNNGSAMYDVTTETNWCSSDNGRYNARKYTTAVSKDIKGNNDVKWDIFVSWAVPDNIMAGTSAESGISHDAALYPVPKLNDLSTDKPCDYHPTPEDNTCHFANAACMNRNRDLNGDGVITEDEIRWYLPTEKEYVQLALGQIELPDPLIKLSEHSEKEFCTTALKSDPTNTVGKEPYHFVSSNCKYLWAEELISVGDRPMGYWDYKQMCNSVRCVRNLGANPAVEPGTDNEIDNPFSYDPGTLTFTLDRYTDVSLRAYVGSYVLPHDIASEEGRPYKKFKIAANYCKNITDEGLLSVNGNGDIQWVSAGDEGTRSYLWYQSLAHNGICGKYYENTDKSDVGTWRVPTFREMGVMFNAGVLKNGPYQLSCSRNHFIVWPITDRGYSSTWGYEFLGYHTGESLLKRSVMKDSGGNQIKIRCVKDVR
jgi:hypothetical protein